MDLIIVSILCVVIGGLAGGLAGLLGVGGGIVIVPALAALFLARGVGADVAMHLALGTSLASIAFTSLASIRAHHARGAVRFDIGRWLAPGLLLGAALAGFAAHQLSGGFLKALFGMCALLIGLNLLRSSGLTPRPEQPIGHPRLLGGGALIGLASGLAGIGGGSLTVPFLSHYGVPMVQAIGTAALGGLPIALGGTLGYVFSGWHAAGLPSGALGYVDLWALLLIVPTSVLAAPFGAKLAHRLDTRVLKRVFALFLIVIGAWMVWRA